MPASTQFRDPWELVRFRRSLKSAIKPSDSDYDLARATFNALLDPHPAVIVPCTSTDDVVVALGRAREGNLPVAVRGGGHGVAGHCVGDGSVVIDLARLSSVLVDPERRTATAGGGVTWAEFDQATQIHGLATPGGARHDACPRLDPSRGTSWRRPSSLAGRDGVPST